MIVSRWARAARFAWASAAVGVFAAGAAVAQDDPDEPRARFGERVDVVEVLVDVQVTDRKGVVVLGLGADDFDARVEGEPARITSVTFRSPYFTGHEEAGSDPFSFAPEAVAAPERRYFVLLFHDLMRPDYETLGVTAQQSIAVAMARQWIQDELLPADLVAVASFDYKLKVHSDFGRDPAVLDRALKRAMMRRDPDRSEPTPVASGPSLLRHLPQGKELRDRSRSIREALWTLAEGLRPLEGRKNLVLFSIGAGLSSYLAPVLNRSNVDVYTVDISPPMAEHLQAVALEALARDTDGHFFRWGSYLDSLRRVSRRTAGYYQLSVLVQRRADGTLPERVAVDVVHPRLRVTARRHYTEGEELEPLSPLRPLETPRPVMQ